ncbi:MAG: hypothetical protein HS104_11570 [Polyangiaceae bacterium]|nr:hypothetical protein [Polyangiaceae bacterium]
MKAAWSLSGRSLTWAQRELLGELRLGPHHITRLQFRTALALEHRGLIERHSGAAVWQLTTEGKLVVLGMGLVAPKWNPSWNRSALM